jgi:amino acid transporter
MALLAVIYLYLVGVFVVFWIRRGDYPKEERWGTTGVAVCIPLLAVRLAYSLIFIITSNMKFNAIKGDATAYLIMTMLPEAIIVAVCTWVIRTKIPLLPARNAQRKFRDKEIQENVRVNQECHMAIP